LLLRVQRLDNSAEAVATAEAAKALASTQDKPELTSRLEEEITLYRARIALRE